ncbi:SIS domain-containing protein [Micromonospora sp. PLK6-60]|nr:SIS domain-containing protein [Micromonospora sp. PLK6-60]
MSDALCPLDQHLTGLAAALLPYRRAAERLADWGTELAGTLTRGGRLLVAGNGGSAAEAQHLTAELVGKLRHDRQPLSALALHAETSALTAIGNDYGYDHIFARQVHAHGRPGDILLLLSTSGTSPNLLTAAHAGRETGLRCWAFTGPTPNPLAELCHDVLAVPSADSQVVQELHLVSSHLLCEYVDRALPLVRDLPGTRVARLRAVPPAWERDVPPARDGVRPAIGGEHVLAGVVSGRAVAANGHAPHARNGDGPGRNGHGGSAPDGPGRNGHDGVARSTGTGWVQS